MKERIIPIIQCVLAVAIIGAEKIWAPVCQGLLDLANGNQTHMKCWFSDRTVFVIAIILIVMLGSMMLSDKSARRKFQPAVIAAAVLMPLTFTKITGMCMMEDMACHSTAMWVMILSGIIGILAIADMLRGGKSQIPE